jgi:glucose-1-phosphate adenylyltransferase
MSKKIIAMILAGGKGTRLESLTKKTAKPAVSFAAKYRIIDFPISNCANSGIDVVGVLTQYESTDLDNYLGNGEKWGLNGLHSQLATIAPRQTEEGANWYKGTADAITQNIEFIDKYNPEHVLILSGDHIYKCRFNEMLKIHEETKADATISVIKVSLKEASRFGLMITDSTDRITAFQEKPKKPLSDLASMGIYIFSWPVLREYLSKDKDNPNSEHDFGKNIIPAMLNDNKKLQVYRFSGYWRDVGTLASLHEANMDIALDGREFDLYDGNRSLTIYTEDTYSVPQYIGPNGSIKRSIANQGALILGSVDTCVISSNVVVEEGASCYKCVIMEGAKVKKGAKVENAIIAPNSVIKANSEVNLGTNEVILISK